MAKKVAPYGTWSSPITADAIVSKSVGLDNVIVCPATSTIYHIESRPSEEGRNLLVNTKTRKDVIDKVSGSWNVRSGVHEYGGGAAIAHDGIIYFSNFADGRVYRVKEGGNPDPVTPVNLAHRFADFSIHPIKTHIIVSILEDHTDNRPENVVNSLVLIDTTTKSVLPLLSGADFYAAPSFSPGGTHLVWQQWSHPDMPWEGAEIHVADVSASPDGHTLTLGNSVHVAGNKGSISATYPSWVNNSTLLFATDASGYQNPWTYTFSRTPAARPCLSTAVSEDFVGPAWVLGRPPSAILSPDCTKALFAAFKEGRNVFYVVDVADQSDNLSSIDCPYVDVKCVRLLRWRDGGAEVVFIGTKVDQPPAVVLCNINLTAEPFVATFTTLFSTQSSDSPAAKFPAGIVSLPRPLTLAVGPNKEPLHVVFYPPNNPEYEGTSLDDEKPPCVVGIHGGPTGMSGQELSWSRQYFTSRGWAWLDVNYGGSSGYGRQYTDRLVSKWGIVDVQDAIHAALALSSAPLHLIDSKRACIRGGSSGGYTVLASLSIAPGTDVEFFAAGTSLYGISDIAMLGEDTHKFESHYMEKLVGGTSKDIPKVYKERSPIEHADRIVQPLLILQGSIDKVVPPEQAEVIVKSIRDRGGRVDYKLFEGEGHGFRKAENIKAALEAELSFYEDVLRLKK